MKYKEDLERIRRELCELREDLMAELRDLPEGELLCTGEEDKRKYYQRLPVRGYRKKERRYGIKKKPQVLDGLIRKEYAASAIEVMDKDIKVLETALRWYKPVDENTVMQEFAAKYPELGGRIYRNSGDAEEWKNAFSSANDFHPESLKSIDIAGKKRRSKNEVYIASRLDHYKLIYRHDCPTGIPGLYRNPDFQIIRPRDFKIIYWEHFGMMDNLEYVLDYKNKMIDYEKAGIVPWDNLMITFGKTAGDLDARMIEAMIQGWLL